MKGKSLFEDCQQLMQVNAKFIELNDPLTELASKYKVKEIVERQPLIDEMS